MRAHDFFLACKAQDWFYSYSDDASVYRDGKASESRLIAIAGAAGGVFQRIYSAWVDHVTAVSRGDKEHRQPKWEDFEVVGNPNPEFRPTSQGHIAMVHEAMKKVQVMIPTPAPAISPCVGDLEGVDRHYQSLGTVFCHDGKWNATAAVLCADPQTLRLMSALRKPDIIQISERMRVKGDTITVYGADFIRHHDGSYTHFDRDNNRFTFDGIMRVLVYVAVRWH